LYFLRTIVSLIGGVFDVFTVYTEYDRVLLIVIRTHLHNYYLHRAEKVVSFTGSQKHRIGRDQSMELYNYMTMVLIFFALIPTIYYFFMFRRIIKTIGFDPCKPVSVCIEVLLCLIVWHFMSHITTSPAIFLYLIPLADLLVLFANWILRKATGKTNDEAGRRVWKAIVGSCIIPLVLISAYFIYGSIHMRDVIQTHYTVTTPKDIPDEGFKVCFLSDVHCGVALTSEDFERISREIEACDVDTVILGGDLLDFNSEQKDVEEMFTIFGSIKADQGIYYIFGNHDRTADYKESLFSEEYIIDQCEKNGIIVLQDEWLDFGNGISLLGREDATEKYGRIRMSVEELFKDADSNNFLLIADHQPCEYALLASHGTDLAIAGHLHAGQLFPSSLLLVPYNDEHVDYGRYLITRNGNKRAAADGPAREGDGTATAIISSGLAGWSYPIRTAGWSEYCIIDIVKEK